MEVSFQLISMQQMYILKFNSNWHPQHLRFFLLRSQLGMTIEIVSLLILLDIGEEAEEGS